MARVDMRGWDTAHDTLESVTRASGMTYDSGTTTLGRGSSLKIVAASGASNAMTLPGTTPTWIRMNVFFTVFPTTTARVFFGTTGGASLRINTTGTITYFAVSTSIGTTAALSLNTWYTLDIWSSTASTNQARLIVTNLTTGAVLSTITTGNTTSFVIQIGASDTVADTFTMFSDDYVTDTASAAGRGYVVLLRPVSDNARAAKWTAGTSGTTNLWDAVNNLPPVGVTSPQTTTSAITHAGTGAGNEDYDANLETYSSAGIGSADTVNAVQTLISHGEDIATGTKTLTYAVKSNPAGSFETNVSAGSDIGAVGSWPTNWTTGRGTIITSPSVTVGTAPVMTARRPLTDTRLADVCFMAMYVDFSKASFIATPPKVISSAVRRSSLY